MKTKQRVPYTYKRLNFTIFYLLILQFGWYPFRWIFSNTYNQAEKAYIANGFDYATNSFLYSITVLFIWILIYTSNFRVLYKKANIPLFKWGVGAWLIGLSVSTCCFVVTLLVGLFLGNQFFLLLDLLYGVVWYFFIIIIMKKILIGDFEDNGWITKS